MEKKESGIRINKYLSEYGICSRREGDRLIAQGKVYIDGAKAQVGDRVRPGQRVTVQGKEAGEKEERLLLIFNKPRGVVCTAQRRERNNIVDYIGYPSRIYPIGRLDQSSEGLIFLTNYGPLANWLTHPSYEHEKEYQVRVDKPVTDGFLKKMASGVPILGTVTNPCKVRKMGEREFSIVLTQGMNRQIRRMCEHFGYRVVRLRRVRILDIRLEQLPVGQYRMATKREWRHLLEQMKKEEEKIRQKGKQHESRS